MANARTAAANWWRVRAGRRAGSRIIRHPRRGCSTRTAPREVEQKRSGGRHAPLFPPLRLRANHDVTRNANRTSAGRFRQDTAASNLRRRFPSEVRPHRRDLQFEADAPIPRQPRAVPAEPVRETSGTSRADGARSPASAGRRRGSSSGGYCARRRRTVRWRCRSPEARVAKAAVRAIPAWIGAARRARGRAPQANRKDRRGTR